MDGAPKKRAYTKSRLIKELAFRAGISQRQSRAALEAIIEIAYREAKANYFILPGLCKFDVVRREPRKVRNPITGEQLMLPARDALRVVLSKRAKEAVAPRVAPMTEAAYAAFVAEKTAAEDAARKAAEETARLAAEEATRKVAEEESRKAAEEAARKAAEEEALQKAAEEEASQKAAEEEAARQAAILAAQKAAEAEAARKAAEEEAARQAAEAAAAQQPDENGFVETAITGDNAISFKCTTCGQEIIAPGEAVGYEAECPACGAILLVPAKSDPGTTYAPGGEGEKKEIISAQDIEDLNPETLKTRTIRIDALLFDDEASQSAPPPSPSADAQKSKTMRIDLPDEF